MLHIENHDVKEHILEGNFGLEKESLRIKKDGTLSHSPHPFADDTHIVKGEITPENKVNLLVFDGELMYVHTNYQNSLYRCQKGKGVVISTTPLDHHKWEPLPMNTLIAYQDGKQMYTGTSHKNEFFETEEKMRLLFLDFANL